MNNQIRLALAALIISLGLAIYGIIALAEAERQRDLQALQSQLNLMAEARLEAIVRWLEGQYAVFDGLARRPELMAHLKAMAQGEMDEDRRSALSELLAEAAERAAVAARQANGYPAAEPLAKGYWAVLDPANQVLVAVPAALPAVPKLPPLSQQPSPAGRDLIGPMRGPDGRLFLGLASPLSDQGGPHEPLGRLLALCPLDAGFFNLLKTPLLTARTAESYLIRRQDNLIEYLSPLLDGSEPLTKRLAVNTEGLLDVSALQQPGLFHQGRDYALNESLAVSRRVPGTDWVLVQRIGAAEALAASDAWRMTLIGGLTLVAVLIGSALVLVWFYASSRKVEELAECYRQAAERFERLSGFLDVLADSQPNPILVADGSGRLTYANRRLAELTGLTRDELKGRSLVAVFGQEIGGRYSAINQQVLEGQGHQMETAQVRDPQGQERVWRSHHQPFAAALDSSEPGVLITIEDLTELMRERARREHNIQQLIDTLIGLVDERDPDAAHQSRYVVWVARAIAEELGFEPVQLATVEQAARLVNIGKIRVPRALLVKEGRLTEQELKRVREALDSGPEILRGIEFEGPVIETLEQVNEWVDGSGRPRGLKGDQILPTAQVVALANAFVAMVSPRAFRPAKSFDEAETILLQEIGRRFARRYVLALLNYLDNRGGRDQWAEMGQRRAA